MAGSIHYHRYLVVVMRINVLSTFCFYLVQTASFFIHIARYIFQKTDTLPVKTN